MGEHGASQHQTNNSRSRAYKRGIATAKKRERPVSMSMASSLVSSPSLSLSSQFSAIIVISDLHHLNGSTSMQLRGSMQWLSNFPEFINIFGLKSGITCLIEFVGKIGVKNVSEIAVISLIGSVSKIEFKNTSEIAIIFLTGRKKSNQKCSIDQDHSGSIKFRPPDEINQDDPQDSIGPFNYIAYYNAGDFAAQNHNDDDEHHHHHHDINDNDHDADDDNEDHEDDGKDDEEKEDNASGGNVEIPKKMEILVYHEEGDIIEAIHTDIIAADLEDWNSLAQRIFELWRQRNDGEAPEISEAINPANCWPGYTTEYSEYLPEEVSSLQFFQWGVDAWEDVKHSLNCLEVRPQHKDQDTDQEEQEHEEESERSRKRPRGMIDFRG